MAEPPTLRERFLAGLAKTRAALSLSVATESPDWDALEESLILADVGLSTTQRILDNVRERSGDYREALRAELLAILARPAADSARTQAHASRAQPEDGTPFVTMMVGVNGVGKTTTAAKLAHRSAQSGPNGKSVLLIAADTFRAAAQEQLGEWAKRIGVPMIEGSKGQDPAAVVHDGLQAALARGVRAVFIDTAGRLHTKRPLMDELAKVRRVASRVVPNAPHSSLLVMDATVGTNGLTQAREFSAALELSGVVLTKMDGSAKGGVVLAIAEELSLPVLYTGVGEGLDDLLSFDAGAFVDALIPVDG